ncbi:MAG: hypothetical protein ACM3ZC_06700 [Bacteroidota bacterium]
MQHEAAADMRPLLRGSTLVLIAGSCLIGHFFLTRALVPLAPGESHQALLRLRGSLVLLGVAWYGRYILFPRTRWPRLRWCLVPGMAAVIACSWPVWPLPDSLSLLRELALIGIYAALAEILGGVGRHLHQLDLATIPARQAALHATRAAAAKLSFLIALAVGVSLYLLAVDYIFDLLVYSLTGAAVCLAGYLIPLALLAGRIDKSLAPALAEIGAREEAALAAIGTSGGGLLVRAYLARQMLLRSGRVLPQWWEWFFPLGSAAILILAAILYRP